MDVGPAVRQRYQYIDDFLLIDFEWDRWWTQRYAIANEFRHPALVEFRRQRRTCLRGPANDARKPFINDGDHEQQCRLWRERDCHCVGNDHGD